MLLDAIGVGSLNYDYIYLVDNLAHGDQQVIIKNNQSTPGGSAANTIFNLAGLNVKTGFVGSVGDDKDGDYIKSYMKTAGIDIRFVKTINDIPTGKVLIFVDTHGERAMYSLPGANAEFLKEDQYIKYLKSSTFVVFSAIPGNSSLVKISSIIDQIYTDTKPVFMPGGLYSSLGIEKIKPIIERTYLMILNTREINTITDCNDKYFDGTAKLHKLGCKNVVVTLGKNGALVSSSSDMKGLNVHTPILAPGMIVDSTGAGDAFTAGLLYGLLKKREIAEAAIYGNLSARACIQAVGARAGLLDQKALEMEFQKLFEGKVKLNE
jgi:ribokinase